MSTPSAYPAIETASIDTAQTPSSEWIAAIILIGSMFMIIVLIMFVYAVPPSTHAMTLTDGGFVMMLADTLLSERWMPQKTVISMSQGFV